MQIPKLIRRTSTATAVVKTLPTNPASNFVKYIYSAPPIHYTINNKFAGQKLKQTNI
jgi:hypothetical protein